MEHYDRAYVETPMGTAEIVGDKFGIVSISVIDDKINASANIPESLKDCVLQLGEYFEGGRTAFTLNLNPKGTDFQKKVWESLLTIPFGTTTTYLKQTLALGNEKAIRAVARANGDNALSIIVPCHRILGSDGGLVGYAGGLRAKQKLLQLENAYLQQELNFDS